MSNNVITHLPVPEPEPIAKEESAPPAVEIDRPMDVRSKALIGLFTLALFYTLYMAREVLLPAVLAILLRFLLQPQVKNLKKLRVPEPLGAALVLILSMSILIYGFYKLSVPAVEWLDRAPEAVRNVQSRLPVLIRPFQRLNKATEEVEKATAGETQTQPPQVRVQRPSLLDMIFTHTTAFIAGTLTMIMLLYFLLVSGDFFLRKLVSVVPMFRDKRRVVEIAREIETNVSTYLSTVTVINLCEGLVVSLILYMFNIPNPLLWGAIAACLNYVPYLGALVNFAILALVALSTLENTWTALLVPMLYLGVNTMEGYIISPLILGHRLSLNPVVVFVGIMFWGWLWGVVGAFLAVPIMASFKIFCDHIESLSSVGEFLGNE